MTADAQEKPSEQEFRLLIEEVASITGRGTLVTGPIELGTVTAGDAVEIVGTGAQSIATVVTAVSVSRRKIARGRAGQTVGLLLRAVDLNRVTPGQVLRST